MNDRLALIGPHHGAAWVGRVVPNPPPSKPTIPKQSTSRLTKTSFARRFEITAANSIALAHSPAPERGPPSPQHSADTHGSALPSRLCAHHAIFDFVHRRCASFPQLRPGARRSGTTRDESRCGILNLHRSPNASPLSPSRARSVSSTFGERSGEGPSKPFKCRSFLTPQSSGTSPAPRHTPAPTRLHNTARISQRPQKPRTIAQAPAKWSAQSPVRGSQAS